MDAIAIMRATIKELGMETSIAMHTAITTDAIENIELMITDGKCSSTVWNYAYSVANRLFDLGL